MAYRHNKCKCDATCKCDKRCKCDRTCKSDERCKCVKTCKSDNVCCLSFTSDLLGNSNNSTNTGGALLILLHS